jgi:hypothetical protein
MVGVAAEKASLLVVASGVDWTSVELPTSAAVGIGVGAIEFEEQPESEIRIDRKVAKAEV